MKRNSKRKVAQIIKKKMMTTEKKNDNITCWTKSE